MATVVACLFTCGVVFCFVVRFDGGWAALPRGGACCQIAGLPLRQITRLFAVGVQLGDPDFRSAEVSGPSQPSVDPLGCRRVGHCPTPTPSGPCPQLVF